MYQVVKRDGRSVDFNITRISNAITKAFDATGIPYSPDVINLLALQVTADFSGKVHDDRIEVEAIQDSVEAVLQRAGYSAIPIISRDGAYKGSLTEGDLLWAVKDLCDMDLKKTEEHSIMEIHHRRDNAPVPVTTTMRELLSTASDQNFVPVVDDDGSFIGIVTRRAIMQYWLQNVDTSNM